MTSVNPQPSRLAGHQNLLDFNLIEPAPEFRSALGRGDHHESV